MKPRYQILLLLFAVVCFSQCEEPNLSSSDENGLTFSHDTITFDTIFTTIGSTTKTFKVINPSGSDILIDRIELAKANESGFRINVDGEAGTEFHNIIVPSRDSLYVFVDVQLEQSGENDPLLVQDSVVFYTQQDTYDVDLLAWGQDFVMVKDAVLKNETWTADKPYLVYNYAFVDSAYTLTIEEGARLYFHDNAGLFVEGSLKVLGTEEEPVIFSGERNDAYYYDFPDQWDGIVLYSGSKNNEIYNARIRNANIGLKVGTVEHLGSAELKMENTIIENMAWAGIWAIKAKIDAINCQVSNVRYYNVALLLGGEYDFKHTTIANYYLNLSEGVRTTESLIISNYIIDDNEGKKLVGNLEKANFSNCIVTGDRNNELKILSDPNGKMNYLFEHTLLTVNDQFDLTDETKYINPLRERGSSLFIDPYEGDFRLDSVSKAIDWGDPKFLEEIPKDLLGISRDEFPDLGGYEYQPYDEEE